MKSQISRLLTASLVIAIVAFGIAQLESSAKASNSDGLQKIVSDLQHEVAEMNDTVHNQATTIQKLQSKIHDQDGTIAKLSQLVASHTEKLKFVTVDGTEMYVTGANLNILNGIGAGSAANLNGLGNLIIGYNENSPQDEQPRTGSHNLVLGENNGYTSYGGIVAGWKNSISGPYATVTGGAHNTASGMFSAVTGGEFNTASVEGAAVSGGIQGIASGRWSSVCGGEENTASAESSAVSGGSANTASGLFSSVSGGAGNAVSGQNSSISGGGYVVVNNQFAWAAGTLVQL